MNERITFVVAALAADLFASLLSWWSFPAAVWYTGDENLLAYLGRHVLLSLLLWLLVLGAGWFVMGPGLIRPRQNVATKIWLMVTLGLAGVVLDTAVSLYQGSTTEAEFGAGRTWPTVAAELLGRTIFYVSGFALVVIGSYLISLRQRSFVTPAPRFGRE